MIDGRIAGTLSWHERIAQLWRRLRLRRGLQSVGLAGALLMFVGLSLLHVFVTPPLMPVDERVHFSYALEVRDGYLPEIETPVRDEVVGINWKHERNTIWVSNHPPLFYAAQAAVVGEVEDEAGVRDAVVRGRLLSLAFSVGGLIFAFLCLRELCSRASKLPVLAIALTVTVPQFSHIMAMIFNDTLGILVTCSALFAAVVILERGVSRRRFVAVLVTASLCAATRASGLMVVAAVLTALAIACYRDLEGSALRRGGLAAAAVGAVALAIAASSGWFYLRNIQLYGDLTGAGYLFEKFEREENGSLLEVLARRSVWRGFFRQMWGTFTGPKIWASNRVAPYFIIVLGAIGVAIEGGLRVWAWLRAGEGRRRLSAVVAEPKTLAIVMLVGLFALTTVSVFGFHSRGGMAHVRYFFGVLWVAAAFVGLGLLRLGPRLASASVVISTLITLLTFDAYVTRLHAISSKQVRDLLVMHVEDMSRAQVLIPIVLVGLGLALVLEHLGHAPGPAEAEEDPAPASS